MALRKIDAMHHYYGYGSGLCEDCPHFCRKVYGPKSWFKCKVYGTSSSESTDWRKGYTACGLIDKPFPDGDRPVVERIVPSREPEQIPGQIEMEL